MKFAHKLTLALLVVLAVVLSLCNTVLIGQQFRQELHTAQETLSADWQRESRAMQRTLVTPGSGSLAARVGSYLQAITEQNSLACAAYSVDGTSLYYALPTAVPLSEVEALLARDGEPRMVLANNHTLLCAGTVVLPERCITLVIAQDAAPVWQARQARTRNALIVELLAMVLAGGLVLLLCRRMTRPLEQLEQASRQIAAGAYSQRTAIHGSDEIASLSRSFDEMAQAVEGTVQTLQQNARQKDDFVAAFTHELKTPMTSILGFADILRSGEVSPATRRTAADYIYHESKRLEALSGNLLALMGLEQQPPQLEAVPLGRVLQSLRRALPQGSPVPTLPRSDAVVLAQPELLCDMLYNLIQNARKATPADGKVEVLLDETPTRLTIRVQDTGCGIPPQELARITEPFYMVDKSRAREQGGSGMGLALCARIAALHGTTLQFASVPSQGPAKSRQPTGGGAMRERKMFFPPALRLAAVAIALSAAALALPLPVFAVLDRAAGHSIAVQQDAEALSPAGRSCAAARELYCWRMTWQNTSRTMVEPDSTPASTAPTLAAVQQLQAAGILPASMADVLLSAMQQTDSCTTYTDDTGQSEYVFTSDENHVTLTLTASGLPVGFTVEQCSFADSALDEIADAYAAFLGGDAIADWETLPLQLHEPCAVRYSVSAQLYLCVARSGQGLRVSAASLSPQDAAAYRGDVTP